MKVVLVAEGSAGVQALRRLLGGGYEVVALLTSGRGTQELRGLVGAAADAGVPVLPGVRVRDPGLATDLSRAAVDLLLNVHSLYLVHEDVLAACRIGAFNLHPGPLPAYAGLNTVSWAIYNCEPEHGVTLHWMNRGVDEGAVAYEARFPVGARETALSLMSKCVRAGLPLVDELCAQAAGDPGGIPSRPQRGTRRCFGARAPQKGVIDWHQPAAQIDAFVRACDYEPFPSPWGEPRTTLNGLDAAILRTGLTGEPCVAGAPGTIGSVSGTTACVATGDQWLRVERVRVGARVGDAAEWCASGQRFGEA